MLCKLLLAVLAAALLSAVCIREAFLRGAFWVGRVFSHTLVLRPFIPEPPGLAARLQALPELRLSLEEREALSNDGFLLVRGLINDTQLLKDMLPALQQHEQSESGEYLWPYLYNGVARALLRDGPLGAVVADAIQAHSLGLKGSPIWGASGFDEQKVTAWHADGSDRPEIMSIWLAVTDAAHSLEFIRGSHDQHLYAEIMEECNSSWKLGKPGLRIANHECLMSLCKERLEPRTGRAAVAWGDLRPGDAWLFAGRVLHRGIHWSRPRLALSARFLPQDPQACGPLPCCVDALGGVNFSVFPRSPFNFACVRERFLARPLGLWPAMDDRLPFGTSDSLKRSIAEASHAAFGRSWSLRRGLSELRLLSPRLTGALFSSVTFGA